MNNRRTATVFGALALGLITLTACDKPTAQATVTVGTKSVQAEAEHGCYAKGVVLPQKILTACLKATPKHHITVADGDKVRIGVDPSIGEKGWLIVSNSGLLTDQVLKDKTYWTVDSAALFQQRDPQTGQSVVAKSVTLAIVETKNADGQATRVIPFTLDRSE